ncbi:hypothetical protein IAU59_007607 [Kwoniella sp. CBS 9459]
MSLDTLIRDGIVSPRCLDLALLLDPWFECPRISLDDLYTRDGEISASGARSHSSAARLLEAALSTADMSLQNRRVVQAAFGVGAASPHFVSTYVNSHERPRPLRTIPMEKWFDQAAFFASLETLNPIRRADTLGVVSWVQRTMPAVLQDQPWLRCWALRCKMFDPLVNASLEPISRIFAAELLEQPSLESVAKVKLQDLFRKAQEFYMVDPDHFYNDSNVDMFSHIYGYSRAMSSREDTNDHTPTTISTIPMMIARPPPDVSERTSIPVPLGMSAPEVEEIIKDEFVAAEPRGEYYLAMTAAMATDVFKFRSFASRGFCY